MQGFNPLRRYNDIGAAHLRRVINRLGLLQIDSVNVLVRAHYLPLYSQLGCYDRTLLDAVTAARPKRFFEYWGHEASLLPIDFNRCCVGAWPAPSASEAAGSNSKLLLAKSGGKQMPCYVASAQKDRSPPLMWRVAGPRKAFGFGARRNMRSNGYSAGLVAATHRRGRFERVYDLPERVLPRAILQLPTPCGVDARRALLARSAEALGVATADDLRDYYRLPAADVGLPIKQLVEEGTLVPARACVWRQQAYIHKDAPACRRIEGAVMLSPFDPLIWSRPRTERLFGFRYRLEIYTPAYKREHGYYVPLFMLDSALVARVDLQADRKAGTLIVQRMHSGTVDRGASPDGVVAGIVEPPLRSGCCDRPSSFNPAHRSSAGIIQAGVLTIRDGPL